MILKVIIAIGKVLPHMTQSTASVHRSSSINKNSRLPFKFKIKRSNPAAICRIQVSSVLEVS